MIIIAEIGINHNGNLNLAHELIRQAKLSGADIAKFQFYDPAKIFGPTGSHPNPEAYRHALTVQLSFEQAKQLKRWCDEEGIEGGEPAANVTWATVYGHRSSPAWGG
ncbi:MAG: N-acetylneuraminate synthase family protein [Candidatus Omnitrophica bacterium]|nr:N-acetylneuraminate synthase family protein [Candidatus Omnitrophota bacterium]